MPDVSASKETSGFLSHTKKAGENITTQPAQQLNIKKGKYKVLI